MYMRSAAIGNKWILLFLFFLLTACSVKKNYKILSLVFDGVPKPGSEKKIIPANQPQKPGEIKREREVTVMLSSHPAFKERKCGDCHDTGRANLLKKERNDICYSCHKKEKFAGDYLHGPIAVGECLTCHLPHESKYERLLKSKDKKACFDCHDEADLTKIEQHEEKEDRTCLSCHLPHAANNKFFLRKK
ncbi:MAG: hypothetical protein KAT34_06510 [Candidatus Aminicenantes bacterium]|nr:hypothetical protein [Candidatus Aminicenantes bacterium]